MPEPHAMVYWVQSKTKKGEWIDEAWAETKQIAENYLARHNSRSVLEWRISLRPWFFS